MNQNSNSFELKLPDLRNWLVILFVIWVLTSLGLGWFVKSVLLVVGFLLVLPIVGFVGFRWWLKRNLVTAPCPVCNYEVTGLNQTQCSCPSCGEPLKIEQGHLLRLTPPGTIDVQAVDVSVQSLED